MPEIINPDERKDNDLTVIYSAIDAEEKISGGGITGRFDAA
jgi:hypothetical protein